MKWYLNIPKKIHFYWSGGKLPYLRYLTVKTFKELNPTWQINLWTSQFKSKVRTWNSHELNYKETWEDWTDKLYRICDNIYAVDIKTWGISNEISEVHKSDLLRYWILHRYGGVYSDTDIFYFKPMINLEVNIEENYKAEAFVCISNYGHSNGFFMASKGSKFFRYLFEQAKRCDLTKYQSNGPDLCNKLFPTLGSITEHYIVVNISMEAVYFYDGQHIQKIFNDSECLFPAKAIGCHWYAGHPMAGRFLSYTNGGLTHLPNNLIGNLCKSLL